MTFDFRQLVPKNRRVQALGLVSLLGCLALLLMPVLFRLDGKSHGEWLQFLGRFHPVIVHLPIGLLLLVPLLELGSRIRPVLREAAELVLWLTIPACVGATLLGFLLAYGSGDSGARVTQHMWGGIALTILVVLCVWVRSAAELGAVIGAPKVVYGSLLTFAIGLMLWATHQGGSLTHGDKYLTEHAPALLKQGPGWLTLRGSESAAPGSFYAMQIHPIFDANCVSCHGESKVKGKLRLDTYDRLMRGGEDGAVVIPGSAERSILFQRITLPVDHKKFMPSEGKPPLKPREIAMIKAWIEDGASPQAASVKGFPAQTVEVALKPVGDYSGLMADIQRTALATGVSVLPVSRKPEDGLILNAVDAPERFGDAQLASFQKFAPYFVELELGRTAVTDGCFDALARFDHLRILHLEGTGVTGSGLTKLTHLSELGYLNLSGTKTTKEAAATLGSMSQIRHLYLYNTPANPESPVPVVQVPQDQTKASKTP